MLQPADKTQGSTWAPALKSTTCQRFGTTLPKPRGWDPKPEQSAPIETSQAALRTVPSKTGRAHARTGEPSVGETGGRKMWAQHLGEALTAEAAPADVDAVRGEATAADQQVKGDLAQVAGDVITAIYTPVSFATPTGDKKEPQTSPLEWQQSNALATQFVSRIGWMLSPAVGLAFYTTVQLLGALDAALASARAAEVEKTRLVRQSATATREQIRAHGRRTREHIDQEQRTAKASATRDASGARGRLRLAAMKATIGLAAAAGQAKRKVLEVGQKAIPLTREVGVRVGKYATDEAACRAREYRSRKNGEEDWLNGAYHDNVLEARASAVTDVGEQYAEFFKEQASEQADAQPNSHREFIQEVDKATAESRTSLMTYLRQAEEWVDSFLDGAQEQITNTARSLKTSSLNSERQAIESVTAAETTATAQIANRGVEHRAEIGATVLAGYGSLSSIIAVIRQVIDAIDDFKSSAANQPAPTAEDLVKALGTLREQMDGDLGALTEQTALIGPRVLGSLNTARIAVISLFDAEITRANGEFGKSRQHAMGAMAFLIVFATQGFKTLMEEHQRQADRIAASGEEALDDAKESLAASFTKIAVQLQNALAASRVELEANLWSPENQQSLREAFYSASEEAASKVDPAWKAFIKSFAKAVIFVVISVAVVVVTVITAGLGGLIGAIIIGTILGALSGGLLQLANNAIDGESLENGLITAIVAGAIGGAAGGLIGAGVSVAAVKLVQLGPVKQLITKGATQLSKAMSKNVKLPAAVVRFKNFLFPKKPPVPPKGWAARKRGAVPKGWAAPKRGAVPKGWAAPKGGAAPKAETLTTAQQRVVTGIETVVGDGTGNVLGELAAAGITEGRLLSGEEVRDAFFGGMIFGRVGDFIGTRLRNPVRTKFNNAKTSVKNLFGKKPVVERPSTAPSEADVARARVIEEELVRLRSEENDVITKRHSSEGSDVYTNYLGRIAYRRAELQIQGDELSARLSAEGTQLNERLLAQSGELDARIRADGAELERMRTQRETQLQEDVVRRETQLQEDVVRRETQLQEDVVRRETQLQEDVVRRETQLQEEVTQQQTRFEEDRLRRQAPISVELSQLSQVLGKRLSTSPEIESLWNASREKVVAKHGRPTSDKASILQSLTLAEFINELPNNPVVDEVFRKAGFARSNVEGQAPRLSGVTTSPSDRQIYISLEELALKVIDADPAKALDANNLFFVLGGPSQRINASRAHNPEQASVRSREALP